MGKEERLNYCSGAGEEKMEGRGAENEKVCVFRL